MLERELKYSSPDDNIPIWTELEPIFKNYKLKPAKLDIIHDRYYDDATNSLEKAGYALRKRKINSKRLATLKSESVNTNNYFERRELELELKGSKWPDAIAKELEGICNISSLRNVIEFNTERVNYKIGQESELAIISFDKVTAKLANTDRKTSFFEIEIEALGSTKKEELFIIAQSLEKIISLSVNTSNKLARAKALLNLGEFL